MIIKGIKVDSKKDNQKVTNSPLENYDTLLNNPWIKKKIKTNVKLSRKYLKSEYFRQLQGYL